MAICIECDKHYSDARYLLGRLTCLNCGQISALQRKHTVVPMHKSNYQVPANLEEIKGINNKGGFSR